MAKNLQKILSKFSHQKVANSGKKWHNGKMAEIKKKCKTYCKQPQKLVF
jgi:hypothetical protein